ncbi:hypothetical protein GQX74_015710 [Glossina fuscipes]|nr:hypothetical protein GQX74_015710 [Glossina fuscipes]
MFATVSPEIASLLTSFCLLLLQKEARQNCKTLFQISNAVRKKLPVPRLLYFTGRKEHGQFVLLPEAMDTLHMFTFRIPNNVFMSKLFVAIHTHMLTKSVFTPQKNIVIT